jgi:hypothetical protein
MRISVLYGTLLLPVIATAAQTQSAAEVERVLDRYLSCQYANGLSVVSTIRREGSGITYRAVPTAAGYKKVSLLDGYRLMVSQGEPSYFANMKVEISEPRQYAHDKSTVIEELEFAMQQSTTGKAVWEHMPYNGFDVYGVNDPTMDGNGPNGIYVLFRDSNHTIVTIYFLGQKPEHRHFSTIEGHDALRDRMIDDLTKCGNGTATVSAPSTLRTGEDFHPFMSEYYLHPQPERIAEAIRAVSPSGVLEIAVAVGPMTGFFSEVFLANHSRMSEWRPIIDKQPQAARLTLYNAISWADIGGLLKLTAHTSPVLVDTYWGAFFASANPEYVRRILAFAQYAGERKDFALWSTGASAKWSLASNSRKHKLIKSILEQEKARADKAKSELIEELLHRDPARIAKDLANIYARQKEEGKWK